MSSFEETGLDPRLLRAISKQGLTVPTAVQSASIPKARPHAACASGHMRRHCHVPRFNTFVHTFSVQTVVMTTHINHWVAASRPHPRCRAEVQRCAAENGRWRCARSPAHSVDVSARPICAGSGGKGHSGARTHRQRQDAGVSAAGAAGGAGRRQRPRRLAGAHPRALPRAVRTGRCRANRSVFCGHTVG